MDAFIIFCICFVSTFLFIVWFGYLDTKRDVLISIQTNLRLAMLDYAYEPLVKGPFTSTPLWCERMTWYHGHSFKFGGITDAGMFQILKWAKNPRVYQLDLIDTIPDSPYKTEFLGSNGFKEWLL